MASHCEAAAKSAGGTTLLNRTRPPVFCPGCSHDNVVRSLDRAFRDLGLGGDRIALVSDIGCSGLFDTFFHTHAFHGLHGRVLTYAAGIKLAQPQLTVVATMGDGGVGIGGAHLLAACRRNLDLTLLILNNYNFGMTGGQCSVTTPSDAVVGSAFLNRLERPMDVCRTVAAAGAPFVVRCSTYQKDLPQVLGEAIRFQGFSVVEIHGICPGRYTRRNRLTPRVIEENLAGMPPYRGPVAENQRAEYGEAYRAQTRGMDEPSGPLCVEARFRPLVDRRQDVMILGSAGQRVVTAGELLGLAALASGLQVTQKNEYNITVLRGPSIAELIVSPDPIDYTGIVSPSAVLALAAEGVARREKVFEVLPPEAVILRADGVDLPPTRARVVTADFRAVGVKAVDYALAGLAALSRLGRVISPDMLEAALRIRFRGKVLEAALAVAQGVWNHPSALSGEPLPAGGGQP
ncbi:MAG: hypothetical protein Kow0092_00970 [Deferrisomatales bacterium]